MADHEGAELPLFWRSILAEEDAREGSVARRIGDDVSVDAAARRPSGGRTARWSHECGLPGRDDQSFDRRPGVALNLRKTVTRLALLEGRRASHAWRNGRAIGPEEDRPARHDRERAVTGGTRSKSDAARRSARRQPPCWTSCTSTAGAMIGDGADIRRDVGDIARLEDAVARERRRDESLVRPVGGNARSLSVCANPPFAQIVEYAPCAE